MYCHNKPILSIGFLSIILDTFILLFVIYYNESMFLYFMYIALYI